jgi:hypothetical protein
MEVPHQPSVHNPKKEQRNIQNNQTTKDNLIQYKKILKAPKHQSTNTTTIREEGLQKGVNKQKNTHLRQPSRPQSPSHPSRVQTAPSHQTPLILPFPDRAAAAR